MFKICYKSAGNVNTSSK